MKYSECVVFVSCQFRENYGAHSWDGTGVCPEYWKAKGEVVFQVVVDRDLVMYREEMLVDAVKNVLISMSSHRSRYEYLSHNVRLFEPRDITDKVNALLSVEDWLANH
jgi:hypothetical protein